MKKKESTKKSNSFKELLNLFFIFLKLGSTSFGGPIAHLSYFRKEFVEKLSWFTEHAYADLVGLCQLLPGPASSQVGIAIGFSRHGYPGALIAWLGFTLPSAILLILFAYGLTELNTSDSTGWLHGLKLIAVAVVAQAVLNMGKTLCPDLPRLLIAGIATVITALYPGTLSQISSIVLGGLLGRIMLTTDQKIPHADFPIKIKKRSGTLLLILFLLLLLGLPALNKLTQNHIIYVTEGFYRAGSLVFGGGHVVLPLLQTVVVPSGMVSNDLFLAGYGAAQAVPGPLFTFAAYLGAISAIPPSGMLGGILCLVAIFLPSFLLIIGVLPFWEQFRRNHTAKLIMQGINAAVVGLLLAALYNPVWSDAVFNLVDFVIVISAFLLLEVWKLPPWLIVISGAISGQLITML